jgi:CheY-like chemotaxis protein
VEQDGLSGAVLDYGLRSEDGDALCERLKQRDIPFIFRSGYGPTSDLLTAAESWSKTNGLKMDIE